MLDCIPYNSQSKSLNNNNVTLLCIGWLPNSMYDEVEVVIITGVFLPTGLYIMMYIRSCHLFMKVHSWETDWCFNDISWSSMAKNCIRMLFFPLDAQTLSVGNTEIFSKSYILRFILRDMKTILNIYKNFETGKNTKGRAIKVLN